MEWAKNMRTEWATQTSNDIRAEDARGGEKRGEKGEERICDEDVIN